MLSIQQSTFYRGLKWIAGWQPLTIFGLSTVILSTIGLRFLAIPQFDLVADILSKSILTALCLILATALVLRIRLGRLLRAELQCGDPLSISKLDVPAGITFFGSTLPPYFTLRVTRRFDGPGVQSPWHLLKGKEPLSGKRNSPDTIVFPHRGYWRVLALSIDLRDALGLVSFRWEIPVNSAIEVGTNTIPIAPLPIVASSARAGDELQQNMERAGDPFDIKPYDPSDGVKRILWKTFARSGQLVVRRPEPSVIPEGELALYLIAGPEEDFIAGAAQGYLEQLKENNIAVLFGTDGLSGMDSESPESSKHFDRKFDGPSGGTPDGYATTDREINAAIIQFARHSQAGTGYGFSSYLDKLSASGRAIQHVVFFGSENGEWIDRINAVCVTRGISYTLAAVPPTVDPTLALKEIVAKYRRPPVVENILRHPLATSISLAKSTANLLFRRNAAQNRKSASSGKVSVFGTQILVEGRK